jgi:hypothetical protein
MEIREQSEGPKAEDSVAEEQREDPHRTDG